MKSTTFLLLLNFRAQSLGNVSQGIVEKQADRTDVYKSIAKEHAEASVLPYGNKKVVQVSSVIHG